MTSDTETDIRRSRRRRQAGVVVVAVVLLGFLALALWHKVRDVLNGSDAFAPSCSWPAHIEHANSVQDGLIRCYLQAIAHRSPSELQSVVRSPSDGGPTGFGSAAFTHSVDARSGTATVTVIGNYSDSADATVAIHYADGAHANLEIHIANPTSADSWRFWNVGIYPPDPNAPPPATR